MKNVDNGKSLNINNHSIARKQFLKNKNTKIEHCEKNVEDQLSSNNEYFIPLWPSKISYGKRSDNFANDVELFVNDPLKVESTNNFFDYAYNSYQNKMEAPYEYASLLAKEYYNILGKDNN